MTSREKEITKKVVGILVNQLKPRKIILFGSRAKGTHRHGSDFDFAVDMKRPGMKKEAEIRGAVEAVSGLYSVDVIYLKSVDPGFRNVVQSTGEVIYGKRG